MTLGSKNDYFNSVRVWKEKYNSKIATSLIVLGNSDKAEYAYDAIVNYRSKAIPIPKKILKKTKK